MRPNCLVLRFQLHSSWIYVVLFLKSGAWETRGRDWRRGLNRSGSKVINGRWTADENNVNRIFSQKLQLYAVTRSHMQPGAVRLGRRSIPSKTAATVMKTSQQVSETKMATPDEHWREVTSPDDSHPSSRQPHPQPHATFAPMHIADKRAERG